MTRSSAGSLYCGNGRGDKVLQDRFYGGFMNPEGVGRTGRQIPAGPEYGDREAGKNDVLNRARSDWFPDEIREKKCIHGEIPANQV